MSAFFPTWMFIQWGLFLTRIILILSDIGRNAVTAVAVFLVNYCLSITMLWCAVYMIFLYYTFTCPLPSFVTIVNRFMSCITLFASPCLVHAANIPSTYFNCDFSFFQYTETEDPVVWMWLSLHTGSWLPRSVTTNFPTISQRDNDYSRNNYVVVSRYLWLLNIITGRIKNWFPP